jgi:hypothetical protein
VQQQATVPLFFGRIFGMSTLQISATAVALAAGGVPHPLNVVFIVDTTGSMNGNDPACGATRIVCALKGVKTLLGELWPCPSNLANWRGGKQQCREPRGRGRADAVPRGAEHPSEFRLRRRRHNGGVLGDQRQHQRQHPKQSYADQHYRKRRRDSCLAAGLPDRSVVERFPQFRHGEYPQCELQPREVALTAPGGFATFYADAIIAAQSALTANARPGATNVIVLLTDGDSNADNSNHPDNMLASEINNQCKAAVTAAQNAAKAGTWVYSIAYGASSPSCSTDSAPCNSSCFTMSQIANVPGAAAGTFVNDPTKFYSDNANGCRSAQNPNITSINSIFQSIGYSL